MLGAGRQRSCSCVYSHRLGLVLLGPLFWLREQGFVAGTSQGQLATFERDSNSKPYRLGRTFDVDGGTASADHAADGASTGRASASGLATPAGDAAASAHAGTPGAAAPGGAASGVRACSLAVCPSDGGVAVLPSGGQLLQLAAAGGDRRGLFSGVQPLAPGFHSGAIVGLSACVRRSVVATAGVDRTIRIWNYLDKSAELVGGCWPGVDRRAGRWVLARG